MAATAFFLYEWLVLGRLSKNGYLCLAVGGCLLLLSTFVKDGYFNKPQKP
jgi:hypothetical protein